MAKKTANESSASAISRWENEGGALAKSLNDAREIVTKLQKRSLAKTKTSHEKLPRQKISKR